MKLLKELFSAATRDRRALALLHKKSEPSRFDVTKGAMRAALIEARSDLASGKLRHIAATDNAVGPCFNMGLHRIEKKDHSIVNMIGLVEQKLRLPIHCMLDVMRDAKDTPYVESLWELFYPHWAPSDYDLVSPAEAAEAVDRWLAATKPLWTRV